MLNKTAKIAHDCEIVKAKMQVEPNTSTPDSFPFYVFIFWSVTKKNRISFIPFPWRHSNVLKAARSHKSQLDFDPNEHCIYFANQIFKSFIHFNNSDSFRVLLLVSCWIFGSDFNVAIVWYAKWRYFPPYKKNRLALFECEYKTTAMINDPYYICETEQ